MDERLVHFSADPLVSVRSREQEDEWLWRGKPTGLWISIEGEEDSCSWSEWNAREDFRPVWDHRAYEISLRPDASILRICGEAELRRFHRERSIPNPVYKGRDMGSRSMLPDWKTIAQEYQGVIIAPHVWACHIDMSNEMSWYYSWDCSSGCIWDADAVAGFAEIDAKQFAPKVEVDA